MDAAIIYAGWFFRKGMFILNRKLEFAESLLVTWSHLKSSIAFLKSDYMTKKKKCKCVEDRQISGRSQSQMFVNFFPPPPMYLISEKIYPKFFTRFCKQNQGRWTLVYWRSQFNRSCLSQNYLGTSKYLNCFIITQYDSDDSWQLWGVLPTLTSC